MGDANYRVTSTQRHEFTLRNPTPVVEVEKAIHWATQKFAEHRGRPVQYDDDLMVEGDEEHVTVFFLVEES